MTGISNQIWGIREKHVISFSTIEKKKNIPREAHSLLSSINASRNDASGLENSRLHAASLASQSSVSLCTSPKPAKIQWGMEEGREDETGETWQKKWKLEELDWLRKEEKAKTSSLKESKPIKIKHLQMERLRTR